MTDPQTGYIETFRSDIPPWELDIVEHFTVAYYYEKFMAAGDRALMAFGQDPDACHTVDCHTRYLAELRKGDQYHIHSAPISIEDGAVVLGHKLFNSATGTLCATNEQTLVGADLGAEAPVLWDGPAREIRPDVPDGEGWRRVVVDLVQPKDLDRTGAMSISAMIHRFSSAIGQLLTLSGMTPDYHRDRRIGYSTFEFQLRIVERPALGEPIDVRSCFAHVGGSSMRLVHRLERPSDGTLLAELGQFGVHLDLDARRPTKIPEPMASQAKAMVVAS
jgi:acyl-CoA thioesterase FadM